MSSIRQNKVARLLQKDLGEIFQLELKEVSLGSMITVTAVRVAPDLSFAKVYLSIFATKDKNAVMQKINESKGEIRHTLGTKVRHQLRIVPELAFYIDDSLDYAEKIENLLKKG